MFVVIDMTKNLTPIKSGFKTASQANNWAKKNLPKEEVRFWGKLQRSVKHRYCIIQK